MIHGLHDISYLTMICEYSKHISKPVKAHNKCILYTKTNLVSHYNETKIIAHKNYLKNNNSTLLLHGNI